MFEDMENNSKSMATNSAGPPGSDDAEIQDLANLVAQGLIDGESQTSIVADLTRNGWQEDEATEFVSSIKHELMRRSDQANHDSGWSGEGMGWLLWIGGILGINLLSYLFNWKFWIY